MVKLRNNHKINTSYRSRTINSHFGFYDFDNEVLMEVNINNTHKLFFIAVVIRIKSITTAVSS
jgi:hypothetical protein